MGPGGRLPCVQAGETMAPHADFASCCSAWCFLVTLYSFGLLRLK